MRGCDFLPKNGKRQKEQNRSFLSYLMTLPTPPPFVLCTYSSLQPEQSAAQASSRPHLVQNPPTAPVSLRVGAKASPAGWLSCSLSDLISDSVPGLYSSFISSDTRSPECCSLCQKHPSCGVSRAPSVPSGFCSNVPPAKRPS